MSQSSPELANLVLQGLEALERAEIDQANAALDQAIAIGGENHPEVLHLTGMIAWVQGDLERASGYLMQAVDLQPPKLEIYLDCAECLLEADDDSEQAEEVISQALEELDLNPRQRDDANLMLAQIRLEADDTDGALAALETIDPALHGHPAFLCTRALVCMDRNETQEAVHCLEQAVAAAPDDADCAYQLGEAYRMVGEEEKARKVMARSLELELAEGPAEPPSYAEMQDLRSRLEGVLEELPDPYLRLVASAAITVQARATMAQVTEEGLDPRRTVVFRGTPATDTAEAELTGITIMRDVLREEIDDDEEIEACLLHGVVEQVGLFFRRPECAFETTTE
jgi:tetratricopeptide (TPR) repeat protein